jgi:pimeloyl-ACP methyl ester carboxylesterase/DNA-binding CsgD family transcriptional regulator
MEPTEPAIRRTRTTDGVAIAYAVSGPAGAPNVVLMPGVPFSDTAAEWRIPVQRRGFVALGARVRFIQYDGRGSGRSQRDVEDLSLDAMLADLDAVVDAERVKRVVLIGFYHSVMLALAWAARHPARAAGLVLFGGSARGWGPMSEPGTQALLSLIDRDWDTFVESAAHAWLGWPDPELGRQTADWFRTATTPAIAKATMREASAIDVTRDLQSIACPVLVLHRAEAAVIPLELSRDLVASLPDARLELLPGTSASLFFEDPEGVADRIAAFAAEPTTMPPKVGERTGARRPAARATMAEAGGLSARELEVLVRIARGDTNAEIAASLGISVNTVERHVSNVYRKIDARGRADATAWALRHGLA